MLQFRLKMRDKFKISGIVLAALCAVIETKIVERTFEGDSNEIDAENFASRRISFQNGTINLTMPGTKWCGPGNTASNYNDLGFYSREDECCRAHDNCDNIAGKQTKYGLTNDDVFTV
jgi:secretory phospholipase A2